MRLHIVKFGTKQKYPEGFRKFHLHLYGEKARKKINLVPLSNIKVLLSSNDLANDVETELLKIMKLNCFALHIESTYVATDAVLHVQVRIFLIHPGTFVKPMKILLVDSAIFDMFNDYFEKMKQTSFLLRCVHIWCQIF